MTKQAVILLHGVGSSGANLKPLADFWAQSMPNTVFVAPNGPFSFDHGQGYQWFSITGVTEANRADRIQAARESFDSTLQGIFAEHQLDPSQDKIILVGFSQGSIMSLDALVNERMPLAGVVAFSGRLSSPQPWNQGHGKPVLLIHGQKDPVISWTESQNAAKELDSLGFQVETHYEANNVHSISQEGAEVAKAFIVRCFS